MTTITKIGNSRGVRIPKAIIKQANLENTEIEFKIGNKKCSLVITIPQSKEEIPNPKNITNIIPDLLHLSLNQPAGIAATPTNKEPKTQSFKSSS